MVSVLGRYSLLPFPPSFIQLLHPGIKSTLSSMCANLLILPHSADTKKSLHLPYLLPAASVLHLSCSHPSVAIHAVYPCLYPFLIRSQRAPSGA